MTEYKFKVEFEIENCYNCPLISDDAFSTCRINENIDIEFERIPKNCPLQKVEESCDVCEKLYNLLGLQK